MLNPKQYVQHQWSQLCFLKRRPLSVFGGDCGVWAGGHLDSQVSMMAPALRNPGPGLLPREPEGARGGAPWLHQVQLV